MITQYIVDEIGKIVTATSAAMQAEAIANTYPINYLYGHPLEVIEQLMDMTSAGSASVKKYPLIALFTDFQEKRGIDTDIDTEVNLNIIIATSTKAADMAATRYAATFKPVLYPIYVEFLNQLFLSRRFDIKSELLIPHTKTDRLYWGKTGLYGKEGNLFNDRIDAIELENLNLKLKSIICEITDNI